MVLQARILLSLILLNCIGYCSHAQLNLLPQPQKVAMGKGICAQAVALNPQREGKMLSFLEWMELPAVQKIEPKDYISSAQLDPITRTSLRRLPYSEEYTLRITAAKVSVDAYEGYRNAMQTLYQLCQNYGNKLPVCTITDTPKFSYRGMHLDVSRHFFTVDEVKRYLDILARYKFNVFHWHLTDDQGWRIEIKKYPLLTEVGSKRAGTIIGRQRSADAKENDNDRQPVEGFYTQEEIKEVLEYASALGILVIPEIEMPGHSKAAIAAYPWLGCTGEPTTVAERWGVFDEVYCAGKDSVFTFMSDVLEEVMVLFNSAYIHIGGDEVVYTNWKRCPHCQKRMRFNNLFKEEELQAYFVRRIEEEVIAPHARRMFGWDELVDDGLTTSALIMSWRGTEGGLKAASRGHDVVMTPGSHCYFDHAYSKTKYEPLSIGGNTPTKKVLAYEPIPAGLDPSKHKHILGAQGNVWAEYIPNTAQIDYLVLPRAIALSEVLWSGPSTKPSYNVFCKQLAQEYNNLDAMGFAYRIEEPIGFSYDTLSLASLKNYTLQNVDPQAKLYYSIGEEEPFKGELYKGQDLLPLMRAKNAKRIRIVMARNKAMSNVYEQWFN
jgi:hexosaminidase